MALNRAVEDFVAEVGGTDTGPVCARGGGTQWELGGAVAPGTREVRAPSGVVTHVPAEMTVRVGAGTTVDELHELLAAHRQTTALGGLPGATVGGVLAAGRNSIDALGHGPVRDVLLEARYASADGRLVTAGGPTVKNVTGFDLCRLLVGSLGTLGLLAEVTLRTRPLPAASAWYSGAVEPFALVDRLYRPAAVLWDGTTTWVHLEGHAADVAAQATVCEAAGCTAVAAPPAVGAHVAGLEPRALRSVIPALVRHAASVAPAGAHPGPPAVAEVGTGVVHLAHPALLASLPGLLPPTAGPVTAARRPERLRTLHERLRDEFDPTRRLNPGRDPLAAAAR